MIPDAKSLEDWVKEVLAAVLVGAVIAAAALGAYHNRKLAHRINKTVDPVEVRRKRLAALRSSQVRF